MTSEWVDRMRQARVLEVADGLGIPTQRSRGSSGGALMRCPSCGAERRHTKARDRRGAVGIRPDGDGWRCWQCDVSGDCIGLVAHELHGRPYRALSDSEKSEVRAWCLRWLGLETGSLPARTARRTPVRTRAEAPQVEPQPEPQYPPEDEVAELWEACRPVVDAPHTRAYLESRRVDPIKVADLDVARALPTGGPGARALPSFARFGEKSWRELAYQLLTPQYDACGALRSLIARNVIGRTPKSLPPRGHKRSGLVIACPMTRQILASGTRPEWWPEATPLRIEVAEGEIKSLVRATTLTDADEFAPCVMGVESGSFTPEIASRIPSGATIFIGTDPDAGGIQHANAIMRVLAPRVAVRDLFVELRSEFRLTDV